VLFRDQRQDLVNASNLRNDLRIFTFDHDASAFGQGGAQIKNVEFNDVHGNPLNWVVGGEVVTLKIFAQAHQELVNPIIGFSIKDHRGQALFGDNTYLSYADASLSCEAGSGLDAEFRFAMP
ncbi:Wzt carbohydrate-binding domain-containing protein, partial [Undibacterium luofuense]